MHNTGKRSFVSLFEYTIKLMEVPGRRLGGSLTTNSFRSWNMFVKVQLYIGKILRFAFAVVPRRKQLNRNIFPMYNWTLTNMFQLLKEFVVRLPPSLRPGTSRVSHAVSQSIQISNATAPN